MWRLLVLLVLLSGSSPIASAWEVDGRTLRLPEGGCEIDAPGDNWTWTHRQGPTGDERSVMFSCLRSEPPAREFLLLAQAREDQAFDQESMTLYASALGNWLTNDGIGTHVQSVDPSFAPWDGSFQLRIRATHRESGTSIWIIAYVGSTDESLYTLICKSNSPDERFDFGHFVQSFRLVDPEPEPDSPETGPTPGPDELTVSDADTGNLTVSIVEPPVDSSGPRDSESQMALGMGLVGLAFLLAFGIAAGLPRTARINPGVLAFLAVAVTASVRASLARAGADSSLSWSVVLEPLLPEFGVALVLLTVSASLVPRYRRSRPRSVPTVPVVGTGAQSGRPGLDTATIRSATGFGTGPIPQPEHATDFRPPAMVGHVPDATQIETQSEPVDPARPDDDDIDRAPGF